MGTIPTHQNAERSRKRKTIFLGLIPLVSEKRFDFSLDLNEVKLFFFSFRKWENNNLSNIAQIKLLASTNKKIVRG